MNLPIIGIARDRSADKGDKAKVSKKYAELYDSPRRSVQYAELPQHDVTLAMGPEPAAFVASPAVAELSVPAPSILHAESLSLYGHDPNTHQALGLPIADAYLGAQYSASFTFLAVADGCGWGNGPAKAAQVAVRSLHEQVTRKLSSPAKRTSHDVAHYLLAALTRTNEKVLQSGSDPADPVTAGTTTVLAGVVCKLVNTSGKCPPYAFIGISLGDCKAYRVSRRTCQVRDVLKGGPRGENATDPGGRLGPADYQRPVVPDLRNLQLVFAYLEPGDAVVLMSDGVHDNLDPVFLGEWDERNGKGKAWPLKELEAKKEEKAQAIVSGLPPLERSAQDLTRVFLRHCTATVQPTIDFMAANKGGGRLKQDFKTLPGKQDHATVLVYNVPLGDAEAFVPPVSPQTSPRSHSQLTVSDTAAMQPPSTSLGGPDAARPLLPLSLSLPVVGASSGSPRLSPAQSPRGPPVSPAGSPSGLKPVSRERP